MKGKDVKTITIVLEESAYEAAQKITSAHNSNPSEMVNKFIYQQMNIMMRLKNRRKKIKDGLTKTLVIAYLSEDVYKEMEGYAKEDNVSITELAETMLTFYLQDDFTKSAIERQESKINDGEYVVVSKKGEIKAVTFYLETEDYSLMEKIASEHQMLVNEWIDELFYLHAWMIHSDMQNAKKLKY